MARPYDDDPWVKALSGPWTERIERGQKPCHYCREPAAMKEPTSGRPAHKACAERDTDSVPLGTWDGEDRKPVKDGPLGCGTQGDEIFRGRLPRAALRRGGHATVVQALPTVADVRRTVRVT